MTNLRNGKVQVGRVASHFLDSGAFTLWTKAAKYAKENNTERWAYYDTDEFWQYMDGYARFVKKYRIGIDLFANVDVIPNPELTWRNQRYLEKKHGLTPVPVVHYQTNLKWLEHYIDRGYELIGLGGLVGSLSDDSCRKWLDRCFDLVCDTPDRLPKVKLHGFGVTSYDLMLRYPWWSVDSTTWTKIGAFGGILVPHYRGGQFVFNEPPYIVKLSKESPDRKLEGRHYSTMTKAEQAIVLKWLEEIDLPLGKMNDKEEVVEFGVLTRHVERRAACLLFFEKMVASIPAYPWPFRAVQKKGFGLLV